MSSRLAAGGGETRAQKQVEMPSEQMEAIASSAPPLHGGVPGSGTDGRSSDERRSPLRQDTRPSSGGLSQGAADIGIPSGSVNSVGVEDESEEQQDAASSAVDRAAAGSRRRVRASGGAGSPSASWLGSVR
jgi:hypothetical protein